MKIRLISDLHIDVNEGWGVSLEKDDVFTLIAGDICGRVDGTIKWIGQNVQRGAFCAGNHIVYDPDVRRAGSTKVPIEDLKARLHERFPLDSEITFMDDDVGVIQKDLGGNLLLVADVMYTDYKLAIPSVNPDGNVKFNMSLAEPKFSGSYLNDFMFGYTKRKMYDKTPWDDAPDGLWRLRTKYYKDHHEKAWKKVVKIVEGNPDKDIILMTHHCLSPKCISSEYVNDTLNASYVSDKESWIAEHPNIRLILSGHVHHRAHFNIGRTLYVLNPLGYCRDTATQYDESTKQQEMWTPNCFVDTDTWELSYVPYSNEKWDEMIELQRQKFDKYLGLFF